MMKLALLALPLLALGLALAPARASAVEGVSYEIFVASFADSDGDGMGDLRGVQQKLPYLQALGVRSLWLMPIHPSPSYHKYDVCDYTAIDPAYGTLADFDALIDSCAEMGIDVLLDLVVNHSSSEHPWFLSAARALANGEESPYTAYYNFIQGEGKGWQPVPGADGWYYEGRFGPHMPDLNLDEPKVRAEIRAIMAFWFSHGVSGFRLDATTSYYTDEVQKNTEFLRFLKQTADELKPGAYLVGEAWTDEGTILRMWESGVDSLFNFPFADTTGKLLRAFRSANGATLSRRIVGWTNAIKAASPASCDAPFISNHDVGRFSGMVRRDLQKEKRAAAIQLLMPGVPFVYYGDELGMTGSGRDENKRLPMLWSTTDPAWRCDPPADADQEQRLQEGADVQAEDEGSLLSFYRRAIALRNQCPMLQYGDVASVVYRQQAICAYDCVGEGGAIRVLHNLGPRPLGVEMPADAVLLGALDTGDGMPRVAEQTLLLPARSTCVLRLAD